MEIVVQCKNIVHNYGQIEVLRGVDLTVNRGEVLSIVGRSGAGKSTLLHILGTLLVPTGGEVLFGGQSLRDLGDARLSAFRAQNIGFVFQAHHLLAEFSAIENVMLSGLIANRNRNDVRRDAMQLLDMMGLAHRAEHKPSALSGGEQQRVAVARALVNHPMVVFADEPTGNLDSVSRRELNEIFLTLSRELNQTFVIVTHESDLSQISDRVVTMSDGRVV